MRAFVVALALGGLYGASAANCGNGVSGAVLVDYAAFTGIVLDGARGTTAGAVGTTLTAGQVTTYKIDVGYYGTVTTATQTCHASDGSVIVPNIVVSGCADGYIQSTYGAAVASGESTGAYVCTACGSGQSVVKKAFQATTGAGVCTDIVNCADTVATAVLKDYAAFPGIVLDGTRGTTAGTVGTSLTAGQVTTYKIDVGYYGVTTTATQTCHFLDGSVAVPDIVVKGCAAGYIQSTYGAETATGVAGEYACTKCGSGETAASKVFKATTGAGVCAVPTACTLPTAAQMTKGMVADATVGANSCTGTTLTAGTKCTYTLDPGYKNTKAATAANLIMTCPLTPGTPTINTANGAYMKDSSDGCNAGYYQSVSGAAGATPNVATCTKCDAGKTSTGVATFASPAAAKDVTCKLCSANFYQTAGTDTTGAGLVCTACADGYTKVAMTGSPKALASLVAADKCDTCASGYRQDVTGTAGTGTCAKCPDNQYIDAAGLSVVTFCTGCKKNNYQSTATLAVASATSTCASCNGGVSTQAPFASTTSCSGCPLNSYQSAGASATWSDKHTCTACGAGFKSLAAQSGWVAKDLTAAKCVACVIGTAGSCATGCPADHYQSAGHVGSCTEKGAAASPATTVAADKTNCGAAAASGSVATGDARTAKQNCEAIVTSSATDAVVTAACDWANAAAGLALVKCVKCKTGKTLANKAVTDLQTASACTVAAAAAASSGVVAKASVATAVAAALAAASVLA